MADIKCANPDTLPCLWDSARCLTHRAAAPDAGLREALAGLVKAVRSGSLVSDEMSTAFRAATGALAAHPAPAPDPDYDGEGLSQRYNLHGAAGPAVREALTRAYEPDRSPQWRSGYLYAESVALGAAGPAVPDDDESIGEPPSPDIWKGLPATRGAAGLADERKTFSAEQGDACRHCRLAESSHIKPRMLCPEWALRASDGDR